MLPRLALAATLALAGLAGAALPAHAYKSVCFSYDPPEEPVMPGGIKRPREVCIPILVDIPPGS